MNARNLAPVAFFVYKRPEHTKRTLEALAANDLASESDLFIFSDGPKNEGDEERVRAVREYIRTVRGFKSVTILEREKNQGLAKSLIDGITELCGKRGSVIVVEDDVLTSPRFLRFMNNSLERYQNDDGVFSICAFWPLKPVGGEAFFLNYFAVWGWATWKRAWDFYDYGAGGWEALLKNKRMAWDFDFQGRFDFTAMLLAQVQDDIHTWDVQWSWIIYREKKLCLFPPRSLATNIGFDALGEHTTSPEGRWITRDIDLNAAANDEEKATFPERTELHRAHRVRLGKFLYFAIESRRGLSPRGIFWTLYRPLRYIFSFIPFVIKITKRIWL